MDKAFAFTIFHHLNSILARGGSAFWRRAVNSQRPGAYYLYNDWGFNAAGAIFEKLTGRDIYDALETDLAKPIGMQDFDRARQQKSGDATRSICKAYRIRLSTRNMARVGDSPNLLFFFNY